MSTTSSRLEKPDLDKGLKDLKLTTAEVGKFEKAFKDPKFLELFAEYAKEISNPEAKAEQDLYLRQLESEGRAEEVYGKDTQLIVPEAAFVFKTKEKQTNEKVFINVCTSEKVESVQTRRVTNSQGKSGHEFDIPMTLGPMKPGKDKTGKPCKVWDFVVHPNTIRMGQTNTAFRGLLAETAIENIEKRDALKLSKEFKETKMKYKASNDSDKPTVLGVRVAKDRKQGTSNGSDGVLKPAGRAPAAALPDVAAAARNTDQNGTRPAGRSQFNFKATQEKKQQELVNRNAAVEQTPQWELVHRGEVDLAASWGDAGRQLQVNNTCPKELVLRITLPGVSSAAAVQLEVSRRMVMAAVPGQYRLDVPLPFEVDDGLGKARFDKSKQRLDVTLPVIPPVLPSPSAAPAQAPGPEQETDAPVHEQSAPISTCTAAEATITPASEPAPVTTEGNLEGGSIAEACRQDSMCQQADTAGSTNTEPPELTENQRKWAELHTAHASNDEPQQACAPPGPASIAVEGALPDAGSDSEGGVAAPAEAAAGCSMASAPVGVSVAPAAQEAQNQGTTQRKQETQQVPAPRPILLEPRLSCTMVNEID